MSEPPRGASSRGAPSEAEAERILREQERRRQELPEDFYARHKAANLFLRHGQERALRRALERFGQLPLEGKEILEVGCGDGSWWSLFEAFGARREDLHGIDLEERRVEVCRGLYPQAEVRVGNAAELPWPDDRFDLVFQSTVFTSILDPEIRRRVAAEMMRVVRPEGHIVWYDFLFDNPSNANVQGVSSGELRKLFPDYRWKVWRVTLAPPLARRLVPRAWTLAALLESIRLLNSHALGVAWPKT
ncbi:MAG: class I SAM-dependent methyltransferase [Acidobacteriota bacterium]|nr:class I SAM-dependent methyltransferase [Acidobacteriota bacterium]